MAEHWTTAAVVIDTWVGPDAPTDAGLVDSWIGKAERKLRREIPDLQARLLEGTEVDLLETVQDVVAAMVTRVFRNPQGIRQQQETVGSFSGSVTFGGDQPGALTILPDELAALTQGQAKARVRTHSMIPWDSPFHPDNVTTTWTSGWTQA